jgi:hypothetical protein
MLSGRNLASFEDIDGKMNNNQNNNGLGRFIFSLKRLNILIID